MTITINTDIQNGQLVSDHFKMVGRVAADRLLHTVQAFWARGAARFLANPNATRTWIDALADSYALVAAGEGHIEVELPENESVGVASAEDVLYLVEELLGFTDAVSDCLEAVLAQYPNPSLSAGL